MFTHFLLEIAPQKRGQERPESGPRPGQKSKCQRKDANIRQQAPKGRPTTPKGRPKEDQMQLKQRPTSAQDRPENDAGQGRSRGLACVVLWPLLCARWASLGRQWASFGILLGIIFFVFGRLLGVFWCLSGRSLASLVFFCGAAGLLGDGGSPPRSLPPHPDCSEQL